MVRFLSFTLVLWVHTQIFAQLTWVDTLQSIDVLFSRYKHDQPGAQLAIARNGRIILSKAWGMAEMDHGITMTNRSILEIASVSKQFVAAAILHLEQEGKLSLEDDVSKYFPELPNYGFTIRIKHLLQQTSGIRDWENLANMSGWPSTTRTYNNAYVLHIITKQNSLNHPPGEEHGYSNSNYVLLAIIVQKASGMSLADYSARIIFEPVGMKSTSWKSNYRKVVLERATAYTKSQGQYYENMSISNMATILSTAEDLIKWNEFYLKGKFGNPSLLSKQLHAEPLNNGLTNSYRAGLIVDSIYGYKRIGHTGATAGFRANLEYFPELDLSIAFLSNTSEFDFEKIDITDEIRKIFLGNKVDKNVNIINDTLNATQDFIQKYCGWYRHEKTDAALKLYSKEGKILSSHRRAVLLKLKPNQYQLGDNKLVFSGAGLQLINNLNEVDSYIKMKDATVYNEFIKYTGEFTSTEADAVWKITIREGKLYAWQRPGREFELHPTYKDGFDSAEGNMLFIRNKKREITGFQISTFRARRVIFLKLKSKKNNLSTENKNQ